MPGWGVVPDHVARLNMARLRSQGLHLGELRSMAESLVANTPPALPEDRAPAASLDHLKAHCAPTQPPERPGRALGPQQRTAGRAKAEHSAGATTQVHAVCITGLERSYPEFSRNVHYSLSNLYSGWRGVDGDGAGAAATTHAVDASWRLEQWVSFFGVRPANDSWPTVRTDLPPLAGEEILRCLGLQGDVLDTPETVIAAPIEARVPLRIRRPLR